MNINRHEFLAGGLAVFVALAADAVVLSGADAENGFAGVVSAHNAKMSKTGECLSFTNIAYDMQINCACKPFYAEDVDRFEFQYRATGPDSKLGGEVFYALGEDGCIAGDRLFRIPPLKRDGKWHVVTIGRETLAKAPGWKSGGIVKKFRFDPTNQDGGTLEIKWFRFARDWTSPEEPVKPDTPVEDAVAKTLDQDVWPSVPVRVWKVPTPSPASPRTAVPPRLVVRSLGGMAQPRAAKAGDTIRLRYDFKGMVPAAPGPFEVTVSILDGETLRWDETITLDGRINTHLIGGDVWRIEFDYVLPLYIDSGELSVQMDSPMLCRMEGSRPSAAKLSFRRAAVAPGWEKPVDVRLDDVGGTPALVLDGRPVAAVWGAVNWRQRADKLPRHSSAPLNVVTLWATDVRKWWPRGEEFEPSEFDRVAEKNRRANPDAFFVADIQLYPPADWAEVNPGEIACDADGNISTDGRHANFSFASEKAMALMEKMMVKAIRHIESSPYANRVIGYRINSGHTIEWLGWWPKKSEVVLDFSEASRRGFEEYARMHYPEISDFSIPKYEERCAADCPEMLLDRRRHARILAYHEYASVSIADDIIRVCRTAKDVLGGRKLVGTYYGYVMTIVNPMRGHFALKRLLDSKAVDFLMSPQWYAWCARGMGMTLVDMKPFRSIQNHGMISVIEDDTRTHNMFTDDRVSLTQALNEDMSVAYMRRNMGIALCRNMPFYTLALTSGAEFDFPQFAEDATRYRKFAEHALAARTRRDAPVAVVVSETAFRSLPIMRGKSESYRRGHQWYLPDGTVFRRAGTGAAPYTGWTCQQAYTDYARIGCGIDYLLAEDVADNPGDYKLYIMQFCSTSTPELRRAAEKLRARNCTILWTAAPGYAAADGNSTESMKELTGLDLARCDNLSDPGITLNGGERIGPLKSSACLYFAMQSPDTGLGRYANGAVAFGACRTGRAVSIFAGTCQLETPILRRVAKEAGVHLYSDTLDPLEANERFVSFHARTAGRKTIKLPRKTKVVEVFSGKRVADGVDAFSFDAPLHSSWLFYCADDAFDVLSRLDNM